MRDYAQEQKQDNMQKYRRLSFLLDLLPMV